MRGGAKDEPSGIVEGLVEGDDSVPQERSLRQNGGYTAGREVGVEGAEGMRDSLVGPRVGIGNIRQAEVGADARRSTRGE